MIWKMFVLGYQNNGETSLVLKSLHQIETATNFIMTSFSIILIAVAVLTTQVMHTISLPKNYRCVSSIKPLPELNPESQKLEPKPTSSRCKLQLNMSSKSTSSVQNSTSPIETLSPQLSTSNSSSSTTKLQPINKSPSSVSKLHDTLKLFKLPLQFISTLLTILTPFDGQNTSSTINPLINLQMPLSLSTIHPHDSLFDSTNNLPISYGPLPDTNTNNIQTSYDPIPASTSNLPTPCNSQSGTINNLPIPCSSLTDKNNLPIIFPNSLPAGNSYNALIYNLLCNIVLEEIRRLTVITPPVSVPESASGDTLTGSTILDETLLSGNTPTDITNDLLTSSSNEPCIFKPTVKPSKPCSIHTLKSTHIKPHSPPSFSTPVNPHSHSKLYPSNNEYFENFKHFKSDRVSLNPQEELILKILKSLNPDFNTSPPFKSKK
uniref:Uncharacterized protein n=1 Tax=Sipha flava TaxID=143950 RepID=A0A2S2Q7F4_9HEMI